MFLVQANSIFTHLLIICLFCTSVFFHSDISGLLQANSIAMLKHEPIKNMVYPYSKTVNWSKSLSSTSLAFAQIDQKLLIDPIKYIPSKLGPVDNLNVLDDDVLNARLTYSVPYLGNYQYDGKEYVGSHPGVDIKLPSGTPIVTIANGIVTKAKYSEIGFGNHVVIRHNHVFNPELNAHEDIYSSYAHLSNINVQAGDIVKVGQIIATSGSSGLSTGAHLNFQIEKDSAPYHPYWPFSDKEIYAAGLNFVSGVNTAYGFSNALTHTYNPLVYIDSAFIDTFLATDNSDDVNIDDKYDNEPENQNTDSSVIKTTLNPIMEYLSASIKLEVPEESQSSQTDTLVKSSFEVASVTYDNHTDDFTWTIPPIIQPAKSYEFTLNASVYDLSSVSFTSNKSVIIDFIEQIDNQLVFTLQTSSLGSIQIQLLNDEEIVEYKNIDSIIFPVKNSNDIDYEKIKLLSIMGFLQADDLDLTSQVSSYQAIKQLALLLNFKGFTGSADSETIFDQSDMFDNNILANAFGYGLLEESELIQLEQTIDFGTFFKKYYQTNSAYVAPLPKLPYKKYVREFGANKLYVQQALIDNLVSATQLDKDIMTLRDLINITYNMIVKK
jgi:murein DD-endopeptidase MepM/ murein hydrolase activator NlpD